MVRMDVEYEGGLHCRLTHAPSGSVITTDAPKDNNGKGEAFSPTDLVSAGLGACMLTAMAIAARRQGMDLSACRAELAKDMVADPLRRIASVQLKIMMPRGLSGQERTYLEDAARNCPVALSLHPKVKFGVEFVYP